MTLHTLSALPLSLPPPWITRLICGATDHVWAALNVYEADTEVHNQSAPQRAKQTAVRKGKHLKMPRNARNTCTNSRKDSSISPCSSASGLWSLSTVWEPQQGESRGLQYAQHLAKRDAWISPHYAELHRPEAELTRNLHCWCFWHSVAFSGAHSHCWRNETAGVLVSASHKHSELPRWSVNENGWRERGELSSVHNWQVKAALQGTLFLNRGCWAGLGDGRARRRGAGKCPCSPGYSFPFTSVSVAIKTADLAAHRPSDSNSQLKHS